MSGKWDDAKLRPCGTRSAFVRHVFRGEEPCQECREARSAYAMGNSNAQSVAKLELSRRHPTAYARFRAAVKAEEPGVTQSRIQGIALKQLTYTFPDEYRALYLAAKQGQP